MIKNKINIGKYYIGILFLVSFYSTVFAQDMIHRDQRIEALFEQIDQRKWRVKIPLWIPGFTGSFAYVGISNLP